MLGRNAKNQFVYDYRRAIYRVPATLAGGRERSVAALVAGASSTSQYITNLNRENCALVVVVATGTEL